MSRPFLLCSGRAPVLTGLRCVKPNEDLPLFQLKHKKRNAMCVNAQGSPIIPTSSHGTLPDNSDGLLAIIVSGQRISGQSGI